MGWGFWVRKAVSGKFFSVPATSHRASAKDKSRRMILLSLAMLVGGTATPPFFSCSKVSRPIPADKSSASENQKQFYAAYGGSDSCRECHAEAYEAWAK